MRVWLAVLLLWAASDCTTPAWAGVLDQVRASGVVRCGAEERAGFAAADASGPVGGLAVELCRGVAVAVLGPRAQVAFEVYDGDAGFTAVRAGAVDIAFLTGPAIAAHRLAGVIVPGPVVFIDPVTLMVAQDSPAHDLADLAGQGVCFMTGSPAQRALEQAAARLSVAFVRLAFQEEVEMLDAYDVQRCVAMAGEATALAADRLTPGLNGLRSRILPRALALVSVRATTPRDGPWAATVAWVLEGMIQADRAETPWTPAGAAALPFAPDELGLRPDWLRLAGSYRALFERTLGTRSRLQMEPGPNAAWPDGLLQTTE